MAAAPDAPGAPRARGMLRAVVRRLSRPSAPATTVTAAATADETAGTGANLTLVDIELRRREPDDARKAVDVITASAFDDVPPPQFYDSAWNTAPLRCEAGRLGHGSDGPVLPPAFTLRSSDLDDTDSDEASESCLSSERLTLSPPSQLCFTPASAPVDAAVEPSPRGSSPRLLPEPSPPRPKRKSTVWRRSTAAAPPAPEAGVLPPSVFDSLLCAKLTSADIRLLVEHDYHGEVVVERPTDIRARVNINLDNASHACTVVFSLHQRNDSCRVSIRRSFADSFRIPNQLFEAFCSDFGSRFRQLRHVPQ
eukprot:TRINITY_DN48511_c0_g1_i1.p1 TRINITY_DN48511_c0_g1~~TRINITY_DN48511_c0_g1_i1.p1  ORF type:complete len:329 (+),score=60.59 TRINITY_DN48511_c0_g1_i1:61-987(+)